MAIHFYDEAFRSPRCEVINPGKLNLPSGKVVVCDPFFSSLAAPFERAVSPGEYDVQLCRADSGVLGKRIALARIVVRPGARATVYEKAIMEQTNSNTSSVESGLASFMDESTRKEFVAVMARFYHESPDGNYYGEKLAAEFRKSAMYPDDPDDAGMWAVHYLPGSALNVVMFASGAGDGVYESFWGLSQEGEIVSLVTDFRILSQAPRS